MAGALVRRTFVETPFGQIHCRLTDRPASEEAPPLLMLHGGPGSSASLLPVIEPLAAGGISLIAPDLMGNGLSDPPPITPDVAFYSDCLESTLDRLGVDLVDIYGHHVGAQIGCELAIRAPGRVRLLVLDGVGLFSADQRREFVERYAPTVEPESNGAHLESLWSFLSNTTVRFPHYSEDKRDLVVGGAPLSAALITDVFADVIRNWRTWHLSYRASFAEDFAMRLPLVQQPAVVLKVEGDPLSKFAVQAAADLPEGRVLSIERRQRADTLTHIYSLRNKMADRRFSALSEL